MKRYTPLRPKRWVFTGTAVIVAAGLVAGLLAWAPWQQSPGAPTAVKARSPTATTVLLTWTAPQGGSPIDRYLILRDGKRVGVVPATKTGYTDSGLAPGSTHKYTVIGESGTQLSAPSLPARVTTITPNPVGLTVTQQTWTTVTVRWSPSPKAPVPSSYVVYEDGAGVDTVPGTVSSATIPGLPSAGSYTFTVAALWGTAESPQSPKVPAETLAPPLTGSVGLAMDATSVQGSVGIEQGETWNSSWTFLPSCAATTCTFAVAGGLGSPDGANSAFTVNLTPSGSGYAGTAQASLTNCVTVSSTDTVTLNINDKDGTNNGAWNAWTGTLTIGLPYVSAGADFCPAETWSFALSGKGSDSGSGSSGVPQPASSPGGSTLA